MMPNIHKVESRTFDTLITAQKEYRLGNYRSAGELSMLHRKATAGRYQSLKAECGFPLVTTTVVIVTHDKADRRALHECLQSVSPKPDATQILVINNGEMSIGAETSRHLKNACIVDLGCNIFPSEARNIGAIAANSEWIYFIDDDAILTSGLDSIFAAQTHGFHAARGSLSPINIGLTPWQRHRTERTQH
jgi:hypothetical protein